MTKKKTSQVIGHKPEKVQKTATTMKQSPGKIVRDGRGRKRNYRKEYDRDHSSPEKIRNRTFLNKMRDKLGLKKGDGKVASHDPIPASKGGKQVKVASAKANRTTKVIEQGTNKRGKTA